MNLVYSSILFVLIHKSDSELSKSNEMLYSDQFVLLVDGGRSVAEKVAQKHGFLYLGKFLNRFHHLKYQNISAGFRECSKATERKLLDEKSVTWFSQQRVIKRVKRTISPLVFFNDPMWPQMWYLNKDKGQDMDIQSVWSQGLTGKGVVVTILDDGLENHHPDIMANYDPMASYDANNIRANPEPRYDHMNLNRHGTRCAGQVAGVANNSICGVGVAYEASIGGIRMLDGLVTDAVESTSLSFNRNHIDIYSASWGPDDDGMTVDGPGVLATKAFVEGVTYGRGGLGSIFVWASGNGGLKGDNCNCDGYTNAIWTLTVSSVSENGLVPWYSEPCSSTIASTYSSGNVGEKQILTADLHHSCTKTHTGTSASAPIAAGICALVLQANWRLTWRDIQHIVIRTAKSDHLKSKDWRKNGVGRNVSHMFGYGLMNAAEMVNLARTWTTVPPQRFCEVRCEIRSEVIAESSEAKLKLAVECSTVRYLEHVQALITAKGSKRGNLLLSLISPSGTESILLTPRPLDKSDRGFNRWPFMTVHSWGENPNGTWTLRIRNQAKGNHTPFVLEEWIMILYGTSTSPDGIRRRTRG